jgi:DNA-binding IclR family transcriptional regulator
MDIKEVISNRTITLKDASKHAQLSLEDTQVVLNELINYGYVERNGFKKFILTEKVYYSFGDAVGYITDDKIV